ncbi:MAG: hypothetical protein ACH37Z_16120 [Anaerolineae bacterium]
MTLRRATATEIPWITSTPTPTREALPSPVPLGSAGLPNASFVHWQDGDATSGHLVLRDAAGEALAIWPAPEGLLTRGGHGDAFPPTLAQSVSPDGRWMALVLGEGLPDDLGSPPRRPPTLLVLDLADGSEAFRQDLLNPAVLGALRARTLAEIQERHPGMPHPPLVWELPTAFPGSTPAPRATSVENWKGPGVAIEVAGGFRVGFGRLAWSHDSRRLAVIAAQRDSESDVYLLEVEGWRWSLPLADPGMPGEILWRPDSRQLFVLGSDLVYAAAGAPVVRDAWLLDVARGALRGHWAISSKASFAEFSPGWTAHGDAIAIDKNHGCIICDIWLLRTPDAIIPVFEPFHKGEGSFSVAAQTLSAWPEGEWLGLSSEHLSTVDASITGGVPTTAKSATEEPGNFLFNVNDGRLERVGDDPFAPVLYWASAEYPFVIAGTKPMAVGPGGKRLPLGVNPGAKPRVAVAEDDRWRVLYGPRGLWVFDEQSQQRGEWTGGPVTDVRWSPRADSLLWIADQQLWLMAVPEGQARSIGAWRGTVSPGYPDDGFRGGMAWLGRP